MMKRLVGLALALLAAGAGAVPAPAEFGAARWIGGGGRLEKVFRLETQVRSARLAVTGVGFYEAELNARKVGDAVLEPSPTDYRKRVLYRSFDVAPQLRPGENRLSVVLGSGWYNVKCRDAWDFDRAPWRAEPCAIARLSGEYADGGKFEIVTDGTWRTAASEVVYDDIREGEIIDPGNVLGRAGGDGAAKIVSGPAGRLERARHPPSRVEGIVEPRKVELLDAEKGVYRIEFPHNLAGWARIVLRGQRRGDVVTVRYDELADGPRRIDQHVRTFASGSLLPGGAFQQDRYVCAGNAAETYEPRFTYSGFKYVTVSGIRGGLAAADVTGCEVRTGFGATGDFCCSSEDFNRLFELVRRSYRNNFTAGFPTDCPHREKNGWTGDAWLAAELAMIFFDNRAGYGKWIRDIADAQRESGEIPAIVPTGGWGFKWGNGPTWDAALTEIPWTLYRWTGDREMLAEVWPAVVKYVDYVWRERTRDGAVRGWGLGDWCPAETEMPERFTSVPSDFLNTCQAFRNAQVAGRMAAALGDAAAAGRFGRYAQAYREAVARDWYRGNGVYANGSQCAQAYPLYLGIVPPAERKLAEERLLDAIEKAGWRIDFGIFGSKAVFRVLTEMGRTDLAYSMIMRPDAPSPRNWLLRGATTLWEDWDGKNSLDHVMFGDFSAWAVQCLAGLGVGEPDSSGTVRVRFDPHPVAALDFAEASVELPCGRVTAGWRRENGEIVQYVSTNGVGSVSKVRDDTKLLDFSGDWRLLGADGDRLDAVWSEQEFNDDFSHCRLTVYAQTEGRVWTNRYEIANPRLWWPTGEGEQHLTEVEVAAGDIRFRKRLGLRKIELAATDAASGKPGCAVVFRVNGRDVVGKGANWTPSGETVRRRTFAVTRDLLESAVAANMNVLRVAGGGAGETEEFYGLCDRLGLMVWQDPVADAVRARQLREHACVVRERESEAGDACARRMPVDLWPPSETSTIGPDGKWRPAHYAVKRAYAPQKAETDGKHSGAAIGFGGKREDRRRQPAKIDWTVREISGTRDLEVELASDAPASCVWVEVPGIKGEFDDNLVPLMPGRPRRLRFTPKENGVWEQHLREAVRVTVW